MITEAAQPEAYDADHFSRTTLILGRRAGDAARGKAQHRSFRVLIIAGAATCSSRAGQAAVLTAVATAVRAFSEVAVSLDAPGQTVLGGPYAGMRLGDTVASEGANLVDSSSGTPRHVIVIGNTPAGLRPERHWIAATWSGWTASTGPTAQKLQAAASINPADGDPVGARCGENNCVAAVAAGALAVAETFFVLMREEESVGVARQVCLNLWLAGSATERGPAMAYAPSQWWLLGLGHLGQGYAHVISWLDYANPSSVQVVLQDTQRAVQANHSTGVLTPADPQNQRKTRIVAAALDRCGLETVIVERRMHAQTPVGEEDMHVALVGVDNLPTRRLIDQIGWKTAIDVGLGAGVRDFDGMTVRRLPGQPSATVPAWQDEPKPNRSDTVDMDAPGLDACGIAELNGVAVGASFVGVIAGAVAVAEATRVLHGGGAYSVMCRDLRDDESDAAPTASYEPPVAARLR
ncbi:hypothetical protein H5V45_09205 [Nocardioides sp. KIGAM211]|uniref:Thiamine biosynthesis protein ThiF n=1 Tax=Nocardioides luti TaxID=2761101 RepID=A0A7X0RI67_9ACTN|nr:hypothetical protein [Nocardioides luti]MBB6627499.1 hypothetical protein [Nocardioides luti]